MDEDAREEVALHRFRVIAPLLEKGLTRQELAARRAEILASEFRPPDAPQPRRIGRRTLERWIRRYREGGFKRLMPQPRSDRGRCRAIDPQLLRRAVALKDEVPERTLDRLLAMLAQEEESPAQPGDRAARSTLHRHLQRLGKTRRLTTAPSRTFHRFEAKVANELWMTDVKYGPYLPGEQENTFRRAYLIAFLDDHSRAVWGAYYAAEDLPSLLDCFKRAMLRRGVPTRVYCDNGLVFRSRQFSRICAELGIRHVFAKAYAPQGKGKIERFWEHVDTSFAPELQVSQPKTLPDLNRLFWAWLEADYLHRKHAETDETPAVRHDRAKIAPLDPAIAAEVFLWKEQRTVDKAGVIRVFGNRYEVDSRLYRQRVEIRYDPFNLSSVRVFCDGRRFPDAIVLDLHRAADPRVQPATPPAPRPGTDYLRRLQRQQETAARAKIGRLEFRNPPRQEGRKDV